MAMTLMAKKLAGMPIGSEIELVLRADSDNRERISGVITDNDCCESLELVTPDKKVVILQYSDVCNLSYVGTGAAAQQTPAPKPVQPTPKPVQPAPTVKLLHQQEPAEPLSASDPALKKYFDVLPRADRQKLSSVFDSFRYGVKINDRAKIAEAATLARQILLREDKAGYYWSTEAAQLCGLMGCRANLYDPETFLVGSCFREAALCANRKGSYALSGAYAVLAMLEPEVAHWQDLKILLAGAMARTDDVSGLRMLQKELPQQFASHFQDLVQEAMAIKGIHTADVQRLSDPLAMLEPLYANHAIADELSLWLDSDEAQPNPVPVSIPAPVPAPAPTPAPAAKPAKLATGIITHLNWAEHTGTITCDNGETCTFRYGDIVSPKLSKDIASCMRSDLDGKLYLVKFELSGGQARVIQADEAIIERARNIFSNPNRSDRYARAFQLGKMALETTDDRRAMPDLIRFALAIYAANKDTAIIREVLELYRLNRHRLPLTIANEMDLVQCCSYLHDYAAMESHMDAALAVPEASPKQKTHNLARLIRLYQNCWEDTRDASLPQRMLDRIAQWLELYQAHFSADQQHRTFYRQNLLPIQIQALCTLNRLEEAEAEFAQLAQGHAQRPMLQERLRQLRLRLAPKPAAEPAPEPEPAPVPVPVQEPDTEPEAEPEEAQPVEVPPYVDNEGWDALGLTKDQVVNYAMNISGPDRTAAILAYLKAASTLNPALDAVYHTVALAANDPMEAPDYSITALVGALADSDADYPQLTDCCMSAAFLRSAFLSTKTCSYTAQSLRDSLALSRKLPALRSACDTLEQFRSAAGWPMDIYADYRSHDVKQLAADLDALVHRAGDLYTRFVLTAPREGASMARLLETRKILFAKDGYLATMLHHIMDRNQQALDAEQDAFAVQYLGGAAQFSARHISAAAVDALIAERWELAGREMQFKKMTATLQGTLRNNLRSNISEVLSVICQWYALSAQSAGLAWRTAQGEEAYQQLKPRLLTQLQELDDACTALAADADAEVRTGLWLLQETARELTARLSGTWRFGAEKYRYACFLRSSHVMLDERFLPELDATFCALPQFNILARIRAHTEGETRTFQQQLDCIYSKDKTCNNYGSARQILEYLEFIGEADGVSFPENADQFAAQTRLQTDMRLRSFRESYALSMNYGQIMQSDHFCTTLEDTARHWYARCCDSQNFGFFASFLRHAEDQIHASARQYEALLDQQLDALILGNYQQFGRHPDFADAIRAQIAQQNFIVAEDWMHRIRLGDFSLDVQKPEALEYLERFWSDYAETFRRVSDSSRTLSSLIGRKGVRNKDAKGAQQLIDAWLSNGHPSSPERIRQLLNLLGWLNIQVEPYRFAAPKTELYEVRRTIPTDTLAAPLHPIAAFGSALDKRPMYVSCLYGAYDCDRLYEKIRTLDSIDGSKVILLDYALGGNDRRYLARKLKARENGLRNVCLIIDRVLLCHLADHYNENLINRILMATAMPFSYCQPYVVESVLTMPPEIFIGRKDELMKIESPDGVNLIYGGRQLGKSALFKKALADIDGRSGQRALLVDIKELDVPAAARKLCAKLMDTGILPDGEITDDWDTLCRRIERRLRDTTNPIRYFLLMLDEADTFIDDCSHYGYRPLVALKDIQQSLPDQFKFVLAGLHNIVRFNRDVALGRNSVITHLPSLKITPFRTPEAQELLTVPLSYLGFSLPSKVTVSQILATVNYFPGLIQLYCKKLIESIRASDYAGYDVKKTPPYVITDDHIRRVLADREFMEQIQEKFEITLKLDQDQGSCYYPLALLIGWMYDAEPSKAGYTAKDVLRHAKDLSVQPLAGLDERKINALMQELQDLNILRSVSSDAYLLASKNFRDLLGSEVEIFEKLATTGGAAA